MISYREVYPITSYKLNCGMQVPQLHELWQYERRQKEKCSALEALKRAACGGDENNPACSAALSRVLAVELGRLEPVVPSIQKL